MTSDDGDNSVTNVTTTSKHSPMAVTSGHESAGREAVDSASVIDENDEEEIHFNTNIAQTQRIYCMRLQLEPEETDHVQNPSNYGNPAPSEFPLFSIRSFWTTNDINGKINSPSRRANMKKKQHRFLEVTDPNLDHIVSQSHVKAITSEDDLIAQTLKKEAYLVANAHSYNHGNGHNYSYGHSYHNGDGGAGPNSSSGRYGGHNSNSYNNNIKIHDSNQMFYEEDGRMATTHHSPINPIFYRPQRIEKNTTGAGAGNSRNSSNVLLVEAS